MAFWNIRAYCHKCGTEQKLGPTLRRNRARLLGGLVLSLAESVAAVASGYFAGRPDQSSMLRSETRAPFSIETNPAIAPELPTPDAIPPIRYSPTPTVKSEYQQVQRRTIGLTEFRRLDATAQEEIIDFVRFRYQSRIENPLSRRTGLRTLIADLSRNLEVPLNSDHGYLSKDLIESIVI